MADQCEVVITGTGVVSPLGIGHRPFWQALLAGRSGVRELTSVDPTGWTVPIGAAILDFQAKEFVTPRKSLKVMCREIQTGFAAAHLAMCDARLAPGAYDPDRTGVLFGADMLYCELPDMGDAFGAACSDGTVTLDRWGQTGMHHLYPLWLLMYLPNMIASHLTIAHDARGPSNTITSGDASSLLALIEACRVIERGLADVMLVGGAGTRLNPNQLLRRNGRNVSRSIADPPSACRPFDAQRDGMVNGEGAGALVLESRGHAESRGASLVGRVLGGGRAFEGALSSGDFPLRASQSGTGIRRSIAAALADARLRPDAIGHVSACGVGTIEDDAREARAIRDELGDVPVTAYKSYFGNLGAGSGAVELAATLLALRDGIVPPNRNFRQADPACPIAVVKGEPIRTERSAAMVLSQSVVGQCAAVIVGLP